jgi:hypothetical protein
MEAEMEERQEIVEEYPVQQVITEEFIAKFEKQAELYQNRYLPICMRLTNEADWINHSTVINPKFSLQCSGAEKLCNPLGVNWDRPMVIKHEREDDKGKFYEYEVEGILKSNVLRRWGWFTGNCDSRDQFFVARGHFAEGDIRKAAFSNWLVNGVTRLAGIRNPTIELLAKGGLRSEDIQRIDYSGQRTGQAKGNGGAAITISEPQQKRLVAIARQWKVNDDRLAGMVCEGWDYIQASDSLWGVLCQIRRSDYDKIVGTVEQAGKTVQ